MNTDQCDLCKDVIITNLSKISNLDYEKRTEITLTTIDSFEEMINKMDPSNKFEFTKEERDLIIKNVEYEVSVTIKRGSYLIDETFEPWYEQRKADLEQNFWNRFSRYIREKIPRNAVANLDFTTNTLVDYAGDPTKQTYFHRKGLVVGDVQSGKTNCYLGLICKAIDAGYNFIIIIAGSTESLRRQTQMRVDEAITGYNSNPKKMKEQIGVGKISTLKTVTLTNTENDFISTVAGLKIQSEYPMIMVIKKNKSVLENVIKWLDVPEFKNKDKLIEKSLLLIDDEADYASLNTSADNITQINAKIRKLLRLFSRTSYIGYTATPYANIFVDPDSYDDMIKEDLFPKDFIYSMWAPTDYIGPKNIFLEEEEGGTHHYMMRTIPPTETLLDGGLKHKKDVKFEEMPQSLKNAVACFFVACTMRDLKGQTDKPMSMMIHISYYNDVQDSVLEKVSESIDKVKEDILSFYALPAEDSLKHSTLRLLHDNWEREYKSLDWPHNSWNEIIAKMPESANKIHLLVVNSKYEKWIDYRQYPSRRDIVIGGNSLTRGLTLEGLTISYFYRKSKQYDTLLQMGRWFGYKKDFAEVCRVWTNPDVQSWFGYVGTVNEELKENIDEMCQMGKTPKEYGLRVQEDITGFSMTSRNKMRTAGKEFIPKNLAGDVRDTMYVFVDPVHVFQNHEALINFYSTLQKPEQRAKNGNVIWRNVPNSQIISLLREVKISSMNVWYSYEEISEYIREIDKKEWDVAIVSKPSSDPSKLYEVNGYKIYCPYRSVFDYRKKDDSVIEMGNRNLKSPGDFAEFLEGGLPELIKQKLGTKSPSAKSYMIESRNPVLMIYYLDLSCSKEKDIEKYEKYQKMVEKLNGKKPVGFAIGFPADSNTKDRPMIRYRTNAVYQRIQEELENE